LPFCYLTLKVLLKSYPRLWKCTQVVTDKPETIGDHLKRRRLELHLFQIDLAKLFGVDVMTIGNWEHNTYPPAKRFVERIIEWLGYDPMAQ